MAQETFVGLSVPLSQHYTSRYVRAFFMLEPIWTMAAGYQKQLRRGSAESISGNQQP
jgi:hypothetical protein